MVKDLFVDLEKDMKNMLGKKRAFFIDERGSATVEAAVVVPFFLLIIAVILHLTFFLYDSCTLERATDVACLRAGQLLWDTNDLRLEKAEGGALDVLAGNLLGVKDVEQDIKVKGDRVEVRLSAQYKWWTIDVRKEKKRCNPVQFIRDCKKTEGVIKHDE